MPDGEVKAFTGTDNLEGGWRVAREIFASGFDPTAIVCANDFMALGVLRALREEEISLPSDISVTGHDNIKLSEFCYPTLSTVRVPRERIGHIVFEKLIAGAENGRPTDASS
jgi:LacI family transcriptional regulator